MNNDFIIANKARKVIDEISNMIEVVPKKYYFQKNKLLSYSYELLENIYMINDAEFDTDIYKKKLLTCIYMIDYILGFFLNKKLVSKKQVEKVLYFLTEITRMTTVWFRNMDNSNES